MAVCSEEGTEEGEEGIEEGKEGHGAWHSQACPHQTFKHSACPHAGLHVVGGVPGDRCTLCLRRP